MKKSLFYIRIVSYIIAILMNIGPIESKLEQELIKTNQSCKSCFITGGAGFIGSNFLKYMFDKYPNYNFLVLDLLTYAGTLDNIPDYIKNSKRFEFFKGSITNEKLVEQLMKRADFVVHFAAESHVTKSIYDNKVFFDTNVIGTQVMMNALLKFSKNVERFIHISTSEVYGTAEYEPMNELHPLNPRSPYAGSKAGADRLVYSFWSTYDLPVVIVRPFNNYGPQQHLEKVIPRFIVAALNKEKLIIHGDGSQTRDWVYTLDIAKALDKILHIEDFNIVKNQVINLGSGKQISIKDIANKILKEFNLDESYIEFISDRLGQVSCHISSTNKAKLLLDWTAETDFDDGLKKTIEWYKNNLERFNKIKDFVVI